MIFSELYSAYYTTVAKIITAVSEGCADGGTLDKIVSDNAFGESVLTVLPSLKSGKWQLVRKDMTTPLEHIPTMPLTLTQKMWLKAISLDKRIKLFGIDFGFLDGIPPLFTPDDCFVYDKYGDGDPYDDEAYIKHFRTILYAIKNGRNIKIEMPNRKGETVYARCVPERLEYSEKDDKFRLVTSGCPFVSTVNIARITKCTLYNGQSVIRSDTPKVNYGTLTLRLSDERNTLERCMLHFAHFEKRAHKTDGRYTLDIRYDLNDEKEMVIRVLSFGPLVEVVKPESFKALIIDKLKSQLDINDFLN